MKRALLGTALLVLGCGSTLPAPANNPNGSVTVNGDTVQMQSPTFTLQPGEEVFRCWYTSVPAGTDLAAVRLRSSMSPGSHHFILYSYAPNLLQPQKPDGTFIDCSDKVGGVNVPQPVWLYSSQEPESDAPLPPGTALPFKARQPLVFNMHYINASSSPKTVQVTFSIDTTKETSYQRIGSYVTFNNQISIPAGQTATFGGDCQVPMGANFFIMSTHSHRNTTNAEAMKLTNGVMGPPLVSTDDWEHATVTRWNAPPYLTFQAGEKLHYQCSYKNNTGAPITVGESAVTNEMCMAVGYYFPSQGGTYCSDSKTDSSDPLQ